jgi:hypothetical protein
METLRRGACNLATAHRVRPVSLYKGTGRVVERQRSLNTRIVMILAPQTNF